MNLGELAELDLADLIEDDTSGFGRAMTLKNPSLTVTYQIVGKFNGIGTSTDAGTGLPIISEDFSVTLRESTLATLAGGQLPDITHWRIDTTDINGNAIVAHVKNRLRNRARGMITYMLRAEKQ